MKEGCLLGEPKKAFQRAKCLSKPSLLAPGVKKGLSVRQHNEVIFFT